jgi:hypothetical protein
VNPSRRIEAMGDEEYLCGASDARASMIRFLFRLFSMFALSVAVILAVLDATRSIAASALVLTPLAASWAAAAPASLAAAEARVAETLHPLVWDVLVVPILSLPGFVVFAVLALLLYAVGRRPRRPTADWAV